MFFQENNISAKLLKLIFAIVIMIFMVGLCDTAEAQASVKVKVSKGVCTVSGKGRMSKVPSAKTKRSIKKVIIKKGVTSIPDRAFYKCRKLKTVKIASSVKSIGSAAFAETAITKITVPKTVSRLGSGLFAGCDLKKMSLPGKFKIIYDEDYYPIVGTSSEVYFNSDLDLANVANVCGNDYFVSENDAEYKSIDGVIYTKDGREIVRVPSLRTELVPDDNCEVFNLYSVLYTLSVPDMGDDLVCNKLVNITIPENVRKISTDGKGDLYSRWKVDVDIKTRNLTTEELFTLARRFMIDSEKLALTFPDHFAIIDGMLIGDGTVVYSYDGDADVVTVPAGVKEIYSAAFSRKSSQLDYTLTEVILPDGIETIGGGAFYYRSGLKKINFPDSLTSIGRGAFSLCPLGDIVMSENLFRLCEGGAFYGSGVTSVTIPDNVTKIPDNFMNSCTDLTYCNVPSGLTEIGDGAFSLCDKLNIEDFLDSTTITSIGRNAFSDIFRENMTVKANVKNIGEDAFGLHVYGAAAKGGLDYDTRTITVEGDTAGYDDHAFGHGEYTFLKTVLDFKTGVKDSFVTPHIFLTGNDKKGNKYTNKIGLTWNQVAGANGVCFEFCSDKAGNKVIKTVKVTEDISEKKFTLTTTAKIKSVRVYAYKAGETGKKMLVKI